MSTIRQSQQYGTTQQSLNVVELRQNEFFDYFFKHKLWDFVRTENVNTQDSQGRQITNNHYDHLGQVDVYEMNNTHWNRIISEKQHQYDFRNQHVSHNHYSHETLDEYRQSIAQLPKYLPRVIAVKTFVASQTQADSLRSLVDANVDRFFSYSPEFTRLLGYQQNGSELKVYFEYPDVTLDRDIRVRQAEKRPYQEDLLWKILFNLTRAASRLNQVGQSLTDIRPSRVYYNQYQVQVLPNGIGAERDGPLANKFLAREPIFYSPEIQQDLQNTGLRQSQQLRNSQVNESFQIGLTVLAAGLLKTEQQLNLYDENRNLNRSAVEDALEDFGRLYQTDGRLLQFILEEFYIRASRQSPSANLSFLQQDESQILFLEADRYRPHIEQALQTQQGLSNRRIDFINTHPQLNIGMDFWNKYPLHYHYDLRRYEYESTMARYQQSTSSQVVETVKHSGYHSQYRQSPIRISNTSHSGIRHY